MDKLDGLIPLLDEFGQELAESYEKEQLARLVVGYFTAVEMWHANGHIPDGLELFHADVRRKLTGGRL